MQIILILLPSNTVRGHQNTPSKAHTIFSAAPDEIPPSPRRSRAGSRSQVPTDYPPLPPTTLLIASRLSIPVARSPARMEEDGRATPTPSRPHSPSCSSNQAEEEMVAKASAERGTANRTSHAPSALEPKIIDSHFHDMDICILLHQMDNATHEVVKKALRKASMQRMRQYRKSFHDHDSSVHLDAGSQPNAMKPPEWAKELMSGMIKVQEHLETLSSQSLNAPSLLAGNTYTPSLLFFDSNTEEKRNIQKTWIKSMYQNETTIIVEEDDEIYGDHTELERRSGEVRSPTRGSMSEFLSADRDDSPGQQFLEELYKLRVKPGGSQSAITHKTWEVARDDQDEFEEGQGTFTESGPPEILDSGN
ncbi:hypothetical protein CY34DRAFT_15278 [Suillus luteus UH-Slu-Lm8-n1]|uniref:Uncharacterized protein n=1 Tax=Suillus luteus UH-Slu-Lm8-n1 TaxID=930992 RepID=A0A0D0B294_9AGAM|nr:hypothetical protein CY34DRAFT_15278 [Suillus luteus UH-Slu-Lm8-n1]